MDSYAALERPALARRDCLAPAEPCPLGHPGVAEGVLGAGFQAFDADRLGVVRRDGEQLRIPEARPALLHGADQPGALLDSHGLAQGPFALQA